jgi:hypothetical protein
MLACAGYGLRGGAVSWESALRKATKMNLVLEAHGRAELSETGLALSMLVESDMEPSDEFARAVLTFAIARSNARHALASATLDEDTIQDPYGEALPLLEDLVDVGLVAPTKMGDWQLQDSEFNPLLIGLLFGSPKGNAARTEVGRIGEALTLRYYGEHNWVPVHVSPISDVYGFDILCRPTLSAPWRSSLAVEAKATSAPVPGPYRFYASPHELRVARRLGSRYEIALWGEIDRRASLDDNYSRLVARGFPRLIRDPYAHVEAHAPGVLTGLSIRGGTISADGLVWRWNHA